MKRIADVRNDVDQIAGVEKLLDEAVETLDVLGDEPGAEADVDAALARALTELDALEMAANFDRPYDSHGAIVTIRAGAPAAAGTRWNSTVP